MRRRPKHLAFRRRGAPAALAIVTIAAFVVSSLGLLPTPALLARLADRAFGEAYPCQGGGCGCASARACWTVCRCQTMEQKQAWAARHGVKPPAYAEVRLAGRAERGAEPACPLCDEPTAASSSCCGGSGAGCCGAGAEPAGAVPGLPTLSALGCGGSGSWLVFVPPPPAVVVGVVAILPPSPQMARGREPQAPRSRTLEIAVPPPRRA